jgi:hypothetical protein
MLPNHRRGSAQREGAGEAVTSGGLEGLHYSTPAAPDNQAVGECHIVGLIRLSKMAGYLPIDPDEWLMRLDGDFFGNGFKSPHGFWIWCTVDHLAIDGFPKLRRLVRKKYGFDFEPMSRREWNKIVGQAFHPFYHRLGCWGDAQ